MNKALNVTSMRRIRLVLWSLIALVTLLAVAMLVLHRQTVAVTSTAPTFDFRAQPPDGGHFTLTDQDGHRVRDTDFAGKYRLIYFGYTFCPDVCPLDMQVIGRALRLFEQRAPARAARLQPIFITVDPARDTPRALKSFVTAFHPRLIGLTGSAAEIAAVKAEFGPRKYHVYSRKEAPDKDGGYVVDHTRYRMLFGPDGKGLAFLTEDATAEQLAREMDTWVK